MTDACAQRTFGSKAILESDRYQIRSAACRARARRRTLRPALKVHFAAALRAVISQDARAPGAGAKTRLS